jgi:hypothetical protein
MKAVALLQLLANPMLASHMDSKEVLMRCLTALKEDPTGLVIDQPAAAPPPDPKMLEATAKIQKAQSDAALSAAKLQQMPQETNVQAEKVKAQHEIAQMGVQKEMIIHAADQAKLQHQADLATRDQGLKQVKTVADLAMEARKHSLEEAKLGVGAQQDQGAMSLEQQRLQHEREVEAQRLAHEREMAAREHALGVASHNLDVHEVLHPPKPAAPKPKGKK